MNTQALKRSVKYIESWVEYQYDYSLIPGMVIAVSHNGKLVMNKAYGYADVENKIKMTPEHLFRVASHSKTFTATALMQLQEKGKLRIDDYAVTYLPWLAEHDDERWKKVTIRQLMSHRAGVIRDGVDSEYWNLERPFPNEKQLQKELLDTKLIYETNTQPKYSNYGYSVLGMIIETVSGQTYGEYVSEHIVDSLGLNNTGPEYNQKRSNDFVTGYSRLSRQQKREPITSNVPTSAMASATGFYANASDLCTYFTAQFIKSGKLLDDESKKEMQRSNWHVKPEGSDIYEEYGLGMEIFTSNNRSCIGHGGGFPGQSTVTVANPSNGIVVVVLTNCMNSPQGIIANSIHNIIGFYRRHSSSKKQKNDLTEYEGRFNGAWSSLDIISIGDKLAVTRPDGWHRLHVLANLEYVSPDTFLVTDTSSYGDGGELVHYKRSKSGKISHIIFGGAKMLPE